MEKLKFSVATTADLEALAAIRKSYPLSPEQLSHAMARYAREVDSGCERLVYLARLEDEAVAYGQLVLQNADNDPELANGAEIAHVHDLRVRHEFQSKGVGRRFMRFIEDEARRLDKRQLTLGVDNWNERAVRLYKNLGYETFKETPGRFEGETCLCMRKTLG